MSEHEPNVWCLLGRKAGDNTQVRSLAEALGVSFTEKHIAARRWELLPHLLFRITLAGIDRGASSELAAPWPDLVITAGRRNEPVARWIRRQSGGHTRLVHIGRPWAPLDSWDLVVTTPQYFLPHAPNILHNQLPLHASVAGQQAVEADAWRERLAGLPRPLMAVLVGGDSGKFVMTDAKGRRLGQLSAALAKRSGGSVVTVASPRTPVSAFTALTEAVDGAAMHFPWGGDNPYQALLALADSFVVTGESMSMLGEASATGKPLYIFDVADSDSRWWLQGHNFGVKPLSHRLAMALGPQRMRRDVGRIQDALVSSGQARWLDVNSQPTEEAVPGESQCEAELKRSAEAVRRLLPPR